MRIIGTAGHVDHGKTALIKALTGIDTDRLPEEKSRGLTIDLGFAHFENTDGEPVGVIDVPGHERFIRNMVAGAWSLDCAVLVVAADDGWMQQSTDHLRVLSLMDIPRILCAVTKADVVSPDRVEEVRTEAAVRFLELTGLTVDPLPVSSITGSGMADLKTAIVEALSELPVRSQSSAYLYVDRSFSIQGAGVVVTGSLAGGTLRTGDTAVILPSRERVKIRGMQSYYDEVKEAAPVCRLACNLQGASVDTLHRGCCLTTNPQDFITGDDFFVTVKDIRELLETSAVKNHSEYEIAAGTFHTLCTLHYYRGLDICRVKSSEPVSVRWNQPFVLIRHGGSRIIGGGRFFRQWEPSRRQQLAEAYGLLPRKVTDGHLPAFNLAFRGVISEGELKTGVELPDTPIERSGGYIFMPAWADAVRSSIISSAEKPGGTSLKELESTCRVDRAVLEALVNPLLKQGTLSSRGGLLFAGGAEQNLSPFGKNLLRRLQEAGKTGFDPAKEKISGAQKELRTLSRSGLAVPLENGIHYSMETYLAVISEILKGRKIGSRFSIPDVKERTGLSRKYSIPVLNRMESDGYVKRDGDERIVTRLPEG